jgi:hypothetical protein
VIAQDVIDRVRELINDVPNNFVAGTRWSDEELLQWISDGQREIVKLKPEANAITDGFQVTGGMPRQRLDPSVAYRLIRVEANGTYVAEEPDEPADGVHEVVFRAGTDGDYSGYLIDYLGVLLSSTFTDLTVERILSTEDPPDVQIAFTGETAPEETFPFSTVEIYSGDNFNTLIATLSRDNIGNTAADSTTREWVWYEAGDVFEVLSEQDNIYSVRFIP